MEKIQIVITGDEESILHLFKKADKNDVKKLLDMTVGSGPQQFYCECHPKSEVVVEKRVV